MAGAALLEAKGLRKDYGKLEAVRGIDLSIHEGYVFGLLGPNGAGKTTTVEMLEGIARPSAGQVLFRGALLDQNFRESIGIQFQATALPDFLRVSEVLELFQRFYPRKMPLEELKRLCSLEEYWDRDHRKLSGGQRQRMLLALALVNDPDIVFLDEPTTGLDPQARRHFWDLVKMVKARGKTVILTTHYMEEAFILCDQIIIMDKGLIVAQGEPKKLLAQHFEGAFVQLPRADFEPARARFGAPAQEREDVVEMRSTNVNDTLRQLMDAGVDLKHLSLRSANLEDLFLALTGKALRE